MTARTDAEQLAILRAFVDRMPPPPPDRRTPDEVARDERDEDRAEAREAARHEPMSGRECDRQADLYYGGAG